MKNLYFYQTSIGKLGIAEENFAITNVFFESDFILMDNFAINETELLKQASRQLQEYLSGARKTFSLPVAPAGTVFMKQIWNCLSEIPYGSTRSYKEITETISNAKAYRAVGNANNKNPIPIFIPCHRVIAANGKLSGYRGGIEIKERLLRLEGLL